MSNNPVTASISLHLFESLKECHMAFWKTSQVFSKAKQLLKVSFTKIFVHEDQNQFTFTSFVVAFIFDIVI